MASSHFERTIFVGDLMILYYPKSRILSTKNISDPNKVKIGLWQSSDLGEFSLEELRKLRSTINQIIVELTFNKNDNNS